jgi:hypothetical protein
MKKAILLLILVFTVGGYGQSTKTEFVGLVKFKHNVIPKQTDVDVNYDYSAIGKHSDYYFKDGNIKWLTFDSQFKMDLFIAKENRDYFEMSHTDTIFTLKNNVPDFNVVDYEVVPSPESILGRKCKVLLLTLKPTDAETPITYRRYYFSDDFYIDPADMANCKSSAYDVIYGQMKSIPLKIEYEFPNRTVVWEATEVTPMKLADDFFKLKKGAVIGYW